MATTNSHAQYQQQPAHHVAPAPVQEKKKPPSAVDELFGGKQMTWPRLVVKGLIEAVLCYNFSHYIGPKHRPEWECWATDKKQPSGNGDNDGENVSAMFDNIITAAFYLALVGCIITVIEMINKKVNNKQLLILTSVCDTILGLCAFAWLIWASIVRLSRDGKICSGATTNVSEMTYPYAYDQGALLQVMLVLMYTIPPILFVATNCGCL